MKNMTWKEFFEYFELHADDEEKEKLIQLGLRNITKNNIGPRLKSVDEDCIEHYRKEIEKKGPKWVKEKYNNLKRLYINDRLLEYCHLLCIAVHEYRRETKTRDRISCPLCFYHRSVEPVGKICYHEKEAKCVLACEDFSCCEEFSNIQKDSGFSLIGKLRRTFIEKYYKKT